MKQIDAALEQKLRAKPEARVRLIVRTARPPGEVTALLAEKGLRVLRTSALINAVTVEGSAQSALLLCDEDWVAHIEEDKPVRIQ
jgi:hypothetical protein